MAFLTSTAPIEPAAKQLAERLPRGFLVRAVEFNFQEFADVDGFDAGVAHVFEGFQNRDALRVNDGLFRGDDDFCFHARAGKFCGNKAPEASQKSPTESQRGVSVKKTHP